MNAMHARCNNEFAEPAFDTKWQLHVRVVEHDFRNEPGVPNRERERRDPNDQDLKYLERGGHGHLPEVKANRRRRIHVQVHVMHLMKSPKKRHLMECYVPEVKRVIEQDQRDGYLEPERQSYAF